MNNFNPLTFKIVQVNVPPVRIPITALLVLDLRKGNRNGYFLYAHVLKDFTRISRTS